MASVHTQPRASDVLFSVCVCVCSLCEAHRVVLCFCSQRQNILFIFFLPFFCLFFSLSSWNHLPYRAHYFWEYMRIVCVCVRVRERESRRNCEGVTELHFVPMRIWSAYNTYRPMDLPLFVLLRIKSARHKCTILNCENRKHLVWVCWKLAIITVIIIWSSEKGRRGRGSEEQFCAVKSCKSKVTQTWLE